MVQERLLLIGIDDTDQKGGIGTGRRARGFLAKLIEIGCRACGVTRHQFLVDPRIPYTSHNSAACLAVSGLADIETIRELCLSFLASEAAEIAQPGLCVVWNDEVPPELESFGRLAQQQVLRIGQAAELAGRTGICLDGLTKPAQGIIGALGSVGLRAGGNDGRFIHLHNIRQADGVMSVREIMDLGVDDVVGLDGKLLDKRAKVDTLGWIRPRLEDRRARLYLQRNPEDANVWIPADRSKSRRVDRSWPSAKQ